MKKAVVGNRLKAIMIAVCLIAALIMGFAISNVSIKASAVKFGWEGANYTTEFEREQDVLDAVNEHNLDIAAEGYMLLKNEYVTYTTSG